MALSGGHLRESAVQQPAFEGPVGHRAHVETHAAVVPAKRVGAGLQPVHPHNLSHLRHERHGQIGRVAQVEQRGRVVEIERG